MSWKAWGQYKAERSLSKDHENYKREALEDRAMSNVFVIINSWTDISGADNSEVVGATYFDTEDGAWKALRDIAHSFETDLDYDATSLSFEDHKPHLQYEEYYIQELTKGE